MRDGGMSTFEKNQRGILGGRAEVSKGFICNLCGETRNIIVAISGVSNSLKQVSKQYTFVTTLDREILHQLIVGSCFLYAERLGWCQQKEPSRII